MAQRAFSTTVPVIARSSALRTRDPHDDCGCQLATPYGDYSGAHKTSFRLDGFWLNFSTRPLQRGLGMRRTIIANHRMFKTVLSATRHLLAGAGVLVAALSAGSSFADARPVKVMII